MSKPIQGDVVLALAFPREDGGAIGPAMVVTVHDENVIDALVAVVNPALGALTSRAGLAEVASISDAVAPTFAPDGSIVTPGTWCRREVCG